MYVLKTNTAIRIPVGPLVDPTDGKTAETALTVTGLSVQLYQLATGGGAVTRTQFAPTASGGSNDMVLVTSSTDGMYDLELTAAQLNFLGNARITFYDVDGFLVHWIDLHVVSAAYFDWMYGSTIPAVNVTQISGDGTAADNLESACDNYSATRGLAGTALPAAAADAAGGLIISDAGGLDADTLASNVTAILEDTGTTIPASLTTIDNEIAVIDGVVDAILLDTAEIGTAGAGLTALATQASVNTIDDFLDTEIAAILADTNELQTDWANGGRLDLILDTIAADTTTDIPALIADVPTVAEFNARTLPSADYVVVTDTIARVTLVDTTTTNTDMVAAAPSAAAVADAVWDEAIAGHAGAGSTGAALSAASSAGDPWGTAIPGSYGAGTAGNILGNRLVGTIATGTHTAQTGDTYARLGAPAGASVSADVAAVKSDTAAILTDTGTTLDTLIKDIPTVAEFEARTLVSSGYATAAALTTVDNEIAVIDGIVDSILEDTGTTLPAALTTIDNEIAVIDGIVDSILVDTAVIGAAGAGLTALPWNAAWDAEVQSECTDALNAYDPPTNAEMVARTLDASSYASATALATVDGIVDAILLDTAEIGTAGAGLTAIPSNETDGSVSAA